MITGLEIKSVATYTEQGERMDGLKKLNFIFGSNGTGKTTISKLIAKPNDFDECSIEWKDGLPIDCFVYNRDFVEKNFHSENLLQGIFTLGEDDADLVGKIDAAKVAAKELEAKLRGLNTQLTGADGNGGKKADREKLNEEFVSKVWSYCQKYGPIFDKALAGTRSSKAKFSDNLLREAQDKSAELRTQRYLEERAASVFVDDAETVAEFRRPDATSILLDETNPILAKKVIGKDDVDIAQMIKRLGNSDWVREGISFYDQSGDYCPFCQQKTEAAFSQSLSEYFDDDFTQSVDAIKALKSAYTERARSLLEEYEAIRGSENPFLDLAAFNAQFDLLSEKLEANIVRLEKKEREPSSPVELVTISELIRELDDAIETANEKTKAHNLLIINRGEEQKILKAEVWRFIVSEAEAHINAYRQAAASIDTAIGRLSDELDQTGRDLAAQVAERQALEARVTSVKPTVDAINAILSSFGFEGFKLDEAEKTGFYKIVRFDGQDAHKSLSEGEKTFITFLYFYQLLKGSLSESDVKTDRIAVFDDPISSLDSEILFIVSTLIRDIIQQARSDGLTKQVFVMTHNVYFHKEVTYKQEKDAAFWIVTKRDNISKVKKADNGNPVKTAYEMLWLELEDENLRPLTIRNTLRRILEYYFKTIGGVPLDDLPKKFAGEEQLTCRSLLSWIHDGSHCFDDGINVITGDEDVQRYLSVFKKIFEKTQHDGHYRMMKEKAERSARTHYGAAAA